VSAFNREDFEIVGPNDAPVVAVLGGISASRHVTSWWKEFVGPEKAIDTNEFRVLSIDYRASGRDNRPVTTYDQALALTEALDVAGVGTVRAIVGASYGGMVALSFGALAPERVERLVVIGAAHESAPIAIAVRVLQRSIVELGLKTGRGYDALVIARGLAITTYTSADEFSNRFESRAHDVADYLMEAGERFADRCTPERFLALSQSLDLHKVRPEEIFVPTTLIAVEEDALVPIAQARELAARISASCDFIELQSMHGHDTFLNAPELIAPFVTRSLESQTVYAHD
jgi:homoserine O-acetyltransferase/O-succinyltransferase